MKKSYIGCEHSSETYLQVAREMKEERARLVRRLTGTENLQDVIRAKRGKTK